MNWFLELFPRYRALRAALKEAAEMNTRLQDQNFSLTEQNAKLTGEAQESRAAQIEALQSMVNIRMQIDFGGMAPYPNAYRIPAPAEPEFGPIATGRVQGRDAVRAGLQEFQEQLRSVSTRQ